MNTAYESLKAQSEIDIYQEIESLIMKNPWAWQSVCAVFGLVGGVIFPLLGAIADVMAWFVNSETVTSYLRVSSIVLCALTLPLLILGASCLDLLAAKTALLSSPAESLSRESTTAPTRHTARQHAH
jgi:hypothetical protein